MRNLVYKLAGLVLLVGSFVAGWLLMRYQTFIDTPLSAADDTTFMVEPGRSLSEVAYELERRGILSDARWFIWMAKRAGGANAIKAGEYRVLPGTLPRELLEMMVSGRAIQYSITLVEGWTFRQVMRVLNDNPYLRHTLERVDDKGIMERLGRPEDHPEGRFFPDTYAFIKGMSDLEFLQRAYRAMGERLEREWADRAEGLPLKSPYEALILASIVEKETALPEERPVIAGVFVRRLLKGMKLQTDPTVIYGLGAGFDGNLRRRDLSSDSPYNTYRFAGLPPTPIAMPGADAIRAGLHPADGETLYFVARGDGSHQFSRTLEEHNQAVAKYQVNFNGRHEPR